jgi:hypothetical protein
MNLRNEGTMEIKGEGRWRGGKLKSIRTLTLDMCFAIGIVVKKRGL